MEALITSKDAATLLNVSKRTLQGYVSELKIPFYRIGGKIMYDKAEIIEWQHTFRVRTAKERTQIAQRYCRTH